jgi:general secretion pathway protein E
LLKATLLGVMAQRLVRTLCSDCKIPVKPDAINWQALVAPWKVAMPDVIYQAEGCLKCRNTGFRGRQGIYEILPMTPAVQALITHDADIAQICRQAMKEGMRTLRLSGAQKVAQGKTTIEEVLRVSPDAVMK